MRSLPTYLIIALALASTPSALAGTPDAPEVTDPAGDTTCYPPVGNEYADIVAAWISDEAATTFNVNIALNKWTRDELATAAGYTLQFEHQGVQFGAVAAFIPAPFGDGWEFANGFVDTDSGELRNFSSASGSFTAGSPALLVIEFSKSHFPHEDSTDKRLVNFKGGSGDFKNTIPNAVDPTGAVPEQEIVFCDLAESSATYEFTVGAHSTHDMSTMDNSTATATANGTSVSASASANGDGAAGTGSARASSTSDDSKDTPALGFALMSVALFGVARVLRRRE